MVWYIRMNKNVTSFAEKDRSMNTVIIIVTLGMGIMETIGVAKVTMDITLGIGANTTTETIMVRMRTIKLTRTKSTKMLIVMPIPKK